MKAVAAQNARVVDPVYHVILSWPTGEKPSDAQAFACGEHALASVGMAGHQHVFAIHRDTRNVHMHIAVNRVHPVSFRAVDPNRDYYKLDRAMRELELRYGWKHDKGPFAVFARGGKMVVDWAGAAPATKGHMPSPARDMERHGDQESLFSYARGAPRESLCAALQDPELTWPRLHAVLARHGLILHEKGRGLAVRDASRDDDPSAAISVKASDVHEKLSKGRLVARLGAFEPALIRLQDPPAETYDRFRAPQRDVGLRGERRQARADARRALRASYEAYRSALVSEVIDTESIRARFRAVRADAIRRRQNVRLHVPDRAARKAQYSVIAFETAREMQRLREQVRTERQAVRTRDDQARLSYRAWVERQAAMGDAAALAQLRGWASAASRRSATGGEVGGLKFDQASGFRPDIDAARSPDMSLPGISFRVKRDGSVHYRVGAAGGEFVDQGDFIAVHARGSLAALMAALLFTVRNCGEAFAVEGDQLFLQEVAALRAKWPTSDQFRRELESITNDADQSPDARPSRRIKRDRI